MIAADDHEDYSFAQSLYPKTVMIPPLTGCSGTGPGRREIAVLQGLQAMFWPFLMLMMPGVKIT